MRDQAQQHSRPCEHEGYQKASRHGVTRQLRQDERSEFVERRCKSARHDLYEFGQNQQGDCRQDSLGMHVADITSSHR